VLVSEARVLALVVVVLRVSRARRDAAGGLSVGARVSVVVRVVVLAAVGRDARRVGVRLRAAC